MKHYLEVIKSLEDELKQISQISEVLLEQMDFAMGCCKIAYDTLKELVAKHGFSDRKSEILFFKKIKPSICSKLLYYQGIIELESHRQKIGENGTKKYFQRELKKILKYMKMHQSKVQYYRCNHTYLDERYFTHHNPDIPYAVRDYSTLIDENFSSWKDHAFSIIMANEMLIEYINKEMEELDCPNKKNLPELNLNWTGSKIDLYELIYAIYLEGSVNHGKVTIVELTKAFEWMFNIELQKEIYKTQERLIRRKDPVKYLTQLMAILRRRINNKLK